MAGTWACPTCDRRFEERGRCAEDATQLVQLVERGDPLIGSELGGYTLRRRLGAGGMGAVYLAFQHSVGREVALKVMQPSTEGDVDLARRFVREARLSAQLSSPHIVTTLDFGQTPDGRLYLAMELVEGETLSALSRRVGPLEERRALSLGLQLCDALAVAHGKQIIHRDLKPSNVMLVPGPPEVLKVLDFGLARAAGDSHITRSDLVAGSANYMAPEVISGGEADPRADLYALGGILYFLLEGEPPFGGGPQATEIMQRQLTGTLRPFSRPVNAAVVELVRRLLEVRPERRPASALDVRARLEALLESNVVVDEPTGKLPPPRRRVGWVAASGAAVTLSLVGALAWSARAPALLPPPAAVEPPPVPVTGRPAAPEAVVDAGDAAAVDAGPLPGVDAGRPRVKKTKARKDGLMEDP